MPESKENRIPFPEDRRPVYKSWETPKLERPHPINIQLPGTPIRGGVRFEPEWIFVAGGPPRRRRPRIK